MSGEIPNFISADEALSFFQSSEEFTSAEFFGGPMIEHRLENGQWMEYNGTDEPINKTEQKTNDKASDLGEHAQLIGELSSKGFAVVVKGSSEIASGTEKAQANYEPNIYGTVYILRGAQIEMHNFQGTKKNFEDLFAKEAWLQEMMDIDDTSKQHASAKAETEFSFFNRDSHRDNFKKASGWESFWNDLLKPKANEQTHLERPKTILDLFTPLLKQDDSLALESEAQYFELSFSKDIGFFDFTTVEANPLPLVTATKAEKIETVRSKLTEINVQLKEPITLRPVRQVKEVQKTNVPKATLLRTKELASNALIKLLRQKKDAGEPTPIKINQKKSKETAIVIRKREAARIEVKERRQDIKSLPRYGSETKLREPDNFPRHTSKKGEIQKKEPSAPIVKPGSEVDKEKAPVIQEDRHVSQINLAQEPKIQKNSAVFIRTEAITIETPIISNHLPETIIEEPKDFEAMPTKSETRSILTPEINQKLVIMEEPIVKANFIDPEGSTQRAEPNSSTIIETLKVNVREIEAPKTQSVTKEAVREIKQFRTVEKTVHALVQMTKTKEVNTKPLVFKQHKQTVEQKTDKQARPEIKLAQRPVELVREINIQKPIKEVSRRVETVMRTPQKVVKILEVMKTQSEIRTHKQSSLEAPNRTEKPSVLELSRRIKELEATGSKIIRSIGKLLRTNEALKVNKSKISVIQAIQAFEEELQTINSNAAAIRLAA